MEKFNMDSLGKPKRRCIRKRGPEYLFADQMELFGEKKTIGFGNRSFHVKEIDRDLANQIIVQNHYSKRFYSGSYIHLGIFSRGLLLGVLQFGVAMNPASQGSVVEGTKVDEYLELNRMWLDDKLPRNSESRALSYGFKYIKKAFPKIAWIQSFSDERCQRFGVVYQAANFLYCGEHIGKFWELDGDYFHDSLMTDSCKANTPRGALLRSNKHRANFLKLRQFRYIYFLKRKFRNRLKHAVKPYPKHNALEESREIRPPSRREAAGVDPAQRSTLQTELFQLTQ